MEDGRIPAAWPNNQSAETSETMGSRTKKADQFYTKYSTKGRVSPSEIYGLSFFIMLV